VVPGLPAGAPTAAQVRAFLAGNHVGSVILQPVGDDPAAVYRLFTATLGQPSSRSGGVDAWFDVGGH